MNYSQLIDKLFHINMHSGVKFGLENILKLDAYFQYPSKNFSSVHVAGTNGKGSVTTKIASALECTGKRVGLYTSPHISCFRERIQINGKMISESEVERILIKIFQCIELHSIPATFFEITTVLAFQYFSDQKVDIAVIETGLGGRLDATNILTPQLSVITSISLEHTEILGTTIERIAEEKAGIIKPGVPFLIGPRVPLPVMQNAATQNGSTFKQIEARFATFEEENQAIAKEALEILGVHPQAIAKGIIKRPPCRFECHSYKNCRLILDVAHNPDGLHSLINYLNIAFPDEKARVVCGFSTNKDIENCLKTIQQFFTGFHLVTAENGRGIAVNHLRDCLHRLQVPASIIKAHSEIEAALEEAVELAQFNHEIVVVCGTFFIMGKIRQLIGISEASDICDLNEKAFSRLS